MFENSSSLLQILAQSKSIEVWEQLSGRKMGESGLTSCKFSKKITSIRTGDIHDDVFYKTYTIFDFSKTGYVKIILTFHCSQTGWSLYNQWHPTGLVEFEATNLDLSPDKRLFDIFPDGTFKFR